MYKNVHGHHQVLKKEYSGKLGAEETRVLTFLVIAALHAYLIILASDSWFLRS